MGPNKGDVELKQSLLVVESPVEKAKDLPSHVPEFFMTHEVVQKSRRKQLNAKV